MKINKGLRYMILFALASGITLGVSAQDSAKNKQKDIPSYQLGTFYVYGNRYKNTSTLGGKINQELKKIPASIDIVTDKEIQKQGATSLSEALQYETGVLGTYKSETSVANSPMIRGFQVDNSNLLVDGMKAYGYYGQMVNPDMYGLEKIEVLKAPSSTFNGAGSLSGVINMQMKSPKKANFSQSEIKIGSKNEKTIRFDINEYNAVKDTAVRFVGSVDKKDLFYDKSSQKRIYVAPSVEQQINSKDNLLIKAFYQSDFIDGNAFYGFERLESNPLYGKFPDKAFFGIKGWDKLDYKQWGINYEWEHKFNENISLNHKGGIRGTSILSQQTTATPDSDEFDKWEENHTPLTMLSRIGSVINENGMSYNLDQYIKIHKESEKVKKDTLIGIDWHYETVDTDNQLKPFNIWELNNVNDYLSGKKRIPGEPPIPLIPLGSTNYNEKEYGVYLSHNEKRDKWNYSIGVRRGQYSAHDSNPRFGYKKDSKSATTGQVGIVYEWTDELLPYMHWNNSFRLVHDKDKNGNLLDPETGRQWEIGLRYEPKNSSTKASIAIFDLRRQHVPIAVRKGNDPNKWYAESIGEMRSYGTDLKVQKEFKNDWKVNVLYSYNKTEIIKAAAKLLTGKAFAFAPRHHFNLGVEKVIHEYADGKLFAGINMRYIGKRTQDTQNKVYLPGVTVFDGSISYVKNNDTWNLYVKNLFNKKYYVSLYENWGPIAYPGAERSVFLSYTHKW